MTAGGAKTSGGVFAACSAAAAKTVAVALLAAPCRGGEAGGEWPCWRGPTGSGTSPDTGVRLVRGAKDVRLLWKSQEQDIPPGWLHPNGYGNVGITGGYGGPMVYRGCVYVAWWVPSGDVVAKASLAAARDKRREKWLVAADDVLLCLEAATGKTLWKTAMRGMGINHQYHNHCPIFEPVAADGRVFWIGSGGWVYATDSATGRPLWEARLGKVADAVDGWKAAGTIPLTRGPGANLLRPVDKHAFNSSPAVADGVVVCNDHSGALGRTDGNGLVALDAATGKVVWTVEDCIATISSPVVWTHRGKRYFVAAGPNRAVALEVRTGRVLWEIPRPKPGPPATVPAGARRARDVQPVLMRSGTPAVCEDYLVLNGNYFGRGKYEPKPWQAGVSCWRIDPLGAKRLWHLPPAQTSTHDSPLIYRGHVFARCADIVCVELATGRVVGKAKGTGDFESLVGSDGRMFRNGVMYTMDAGRFAAFGAVRLAIPCEPYVTPAFHAGRLYVRAPREGRGSLARRSRGCIWCYDFRQPGAVTPARTKEQPG